MKHRLIDYFESLGIKVFTNTKAHGYQGYFFDNKIEISKNIKRGRIVPTLLHEFSHYIHSKLEPNLLETRGSLRVLFNTKENETLATLQKELIAVTHFVDKNSLCPLLDINKKKINNEIQKLESQIKKEYPQFTKSKKIKDFDELIDNVEEDFKSMPKAFYTYKDLKTSQKDKVRISRNIKKFKKYYSTPAELFARLIEGLYLDDKKVYKIAPRTCKRFFELLENGYYLELKNVFKILSFYPLVE